METGFFFVYGTLKKGGLYAERFDKFRISSEKASIKNMDLYKINFYPGMVPGNGVVIGELHEYKEPGMIIQAMDYIEGCTGTQHDLFIRKHKIIITESGKEVEAIVYTFNHEIEGMQLIKNGIWNNNNKEDNYENK